MLGGATAAITSLPGAAMSGLRMSPPVVVDGPRDEKSVISGTFGAAASSAAVSGHDLRRGAGSGRGDVRLDGGAVDVVDVRGGDGVVVAVERVGRGVGEDHAHAAGALDLEALVDAGVHAAIADDDLAGCLGRVERAGDAQLRVAPRQRSELDAARGDDWRERRQRRASSTRRRSGSPLPSSTTWNARRNVDAATVVTHGAGWSSVLAPGPLLPAELATKTPAFDAPRKAWATESSTDDSLEPPIE